MSKLQYEVRWNGRTLIINADGMTKFDDVIFYVNSVNEDVEVWQYSGLNVPFSDFKIFREVDKKDLDI